MKLLVVTLLRILALSFLLSGCASDYSVTVTNGSVKLDKKFWKQMPNEEAFAQNFEAREKRSGEDFNQVLTVFKSPIRDDQKLGFGIDSNTWVEFMMIHPPSVTLQIRRAHEGYWVMSRQTLAYRPMSGVHSEAYRPFLSAEESRALSLIYSDEVARVRSILDTLVAH